MRKNRKGELYIGGNKEVRGDEEKGNIFNVYKWFRRLRKRDEKKQGNI